MRNLNTINQIIVFKKEDENFFSEVSVKGITDYRPFLGPLVDYVETALLIEEESFKVNTRVTLKLKEVDNGLYIFEASESAWEKVYCIDGIWYEQNYYTGETRKETK